MLGKKASAGKVAISSFLSALLVVVVAASVFARCSREAPKPAAAADDDLRLSWTPAPADENGFEALSGVRVTAPDSRIPFDKLLRFEGADSQMRKSATSFVEDNRAALDALEIALSRPRFQVPEVRYIDQERDYSRTLDDLAPFLGVHSTVLLRAGREREAFDQAVEILELAHRLEGADGPVSVWTLGQVARDSGIAELRFLLSETSVGSADLKALLPRLAQASPEPQAIVDALKREYMSLANRLDLALSESKEKAEQMAPKIEEARRLAMDTYRVGIRLVGMPLSDARPLLPPPIDSFEPFDSTLDFKLVRDIRRRLAYIRSGSLFQNRCRRSMEHGAIQLLVALRCYELDHGALPDALDQLVPDYLDGVPVDHFDGMPMRYSAKDRIVYSVGFNAVDEGGSAEEAWQALKDKDFTIRFRDFSFAVAKIGRR